ncbi:hypothetical protein JCM24511_03675 [Saitozyma sp. JCM 24511]|jgi:hypothetical protein|nr:hypothetical protein JCM24511_03675 [Saitozyma sp. JCM 24511]
MENAPYLPLYHATSKGIVLSPIQENQLHRKIGTAFVFLPLVLFAALICVALAPSAAGWVFKMVVPATTT